MVSAKKKNKKVKRLSQVQSRSIMEEEKTTTVPSVAVAGDDVALDNDNDASSMHDSRKEDLVAAAELGMLDVPNVDDEIDNMSAVSMTRSQSTTSSTNKEEQQQLRRQSSKHELSPSTLVNIAHPDQFKNVHEEEDSIDLEEESLGAAKEVKGHSSTVAVSLSAGDLTELNDVTSERSTSIRTAEEIKLSTQLEVLEDLNLVEDQVAWCIGQGLLDKPPSNNSSSYRGGGRRMVYGGVQRAMSDDGLDATSSIYDDSNNDSGETSLRSEGHADEERNHRYAQRQRRITRRQKRRKPRSLQTLTTTAQDDNKKSTTERPQRLTRLADSGLLQDVMGSDDLNSLFHDIDTERAERNAGIVVQAPFRQESMKRFMLDNTSSEEDDEEGTSEEQQQEKEDEAVPSSSNNKKKGKKFRKGLGKATMLVSHAFNKKMDNNKKTLRKDLAAEIMNDDDDESSNNIIPNHNKTTRKKGSSKKGNNTKEMSKPVGFSSFNYQRKLLLQRSNNQASCSDISLGSTSMKDVYSGNNSPGSGYRKRVMWLMSILGIMAAFVAITMIILSLPKTAGTAAADDSSTNNNKEQMVFQREGSIEKDFQNVLSWFERGIPLSVDEDESDPALKGSYQGLRHLAAEAANMDP
mmetsp:Transcript_15027/g.23090  ORF Transcript_15027/g.23090 Transcript_15027/m.23090 type:complete len:634 (+) Transcript_15027:90-1991(+)